jgi:hypothetical protein
LILLHDAENLSNPGIQTVYHEGQAPNNPAPVRDLARRKPYGSAFYVQRKGAP